MTDAPTANYIEQFRAEFEEEVGEAGRLLFGSAADRKKAKKHIARASELGVILYELRYGKTA